VDILAFDYYDNTGGADSWLASFKRTVELVDKLGISHNKVTVTSETGMSTNGIVNNRRAAWFTDVLDIVSESNMAYFLVWANFSGDNYHSPYKTSATRGHRLVNEFIDFYNNPKSLFADGTHFYR
jgi:mannan endo-1,4-beta-mannosidase